MERLRSELASFDAKERLVLLLEGVGDPEASELADSILAVLNEAYTKGYKPIENGTKELPDLGNAVHEVRSAQFLQPNDLFDVFFLKESLVLQCPSARQIIIEIPYTAIERVAMADVLPSDLRAALGFTQGVGIPELEATEGHLFIHLARGCQVNYQGRSYHTLAMKTTKETSTADPDATAQTVGANTAAALGHMLGVGIPEEKFDRLSKFRTSTGGCFFSAIYKRHTGHLFLMEDSLCLMSDTALYLPHKQIVAAVVTTSRRGCFTLKLYMDTNNEVHELRQIRNVDKSIVLDYLSTKKINRMAESDIETLRIRQTQASFQDDRERPAEFIKDPQQPTAQSCHPSQDQVPHRTQEELEPIEELSEASESTLDDETDTSESGSKGNPTPDRIEILHVLAGEELPEHDEKDADYKPADMSPTGSKRKRTTTDDPEIGSQ